MPIRPEMRGRMVDAGPAREHVRQLVVNGMKQAEIARIADIHPASVQILLNGHFEPGRPAQSKIHASTAKRLLAVEFDPGYLGYSLAEPVSELLNTEEMRAIKLLRDEMAIDVLRTYQFWEAMVARLTTGTLTGHRCPWDVELNQGPHRIRIEVKFAQETSCRFSDGPRLIFKWANPKGQKTEKTAHVVTLLGIDANDEVHCWIVPGRALRKSRSVTLTSPRERLGPHHSRSIDGYRCPVTQLLPEVLRAYRAHLAMASHTRAIRAAGDAPSLFPELEV